MYVCFTCWHSFWKLLTDNINSHSIWSNSWGVLWLRGLIGTKFQPFWQMPYLADWVQGYCLSFNSLSMVGCLHSLNSIFLKVWFSVFQNITPLAVSLLLMHEIYRNLRSLSIYKIEPGQGDDTSISKWWKQV